MKNRIHLKPVLPGGGLCKRNVPEIVVRPPLNRLVLSPLDGAKGGQIHQDLNFLLGMILGLDHGCGDKEDQYSKAEIHDVRSVSRSRNDCNYFFWPISLSPRERVRKKIGQDDKWGLGQSYIDVQARSSFS